MPFADVNWIALLAAAVASFVFGAIWYMSLAKSWMAAIGRSEAELKAQASPLPYVIALVAQFVMAFVLMQLLVRLDALGLGAALKAALFLWLGFVLSTLAVNHAFQQSRRSLTLIDGGHWLGVLLVQALVLSLVGL